MIGKEKRYKYSQPDEEGNTPNPVTKTSFTRNTWPTRVSKGRATG